MKLFKPFLFMALLVLVASCSDDDDNTPEEINEEEVITTLTITLTSPGNPDIVIQSRDLDGDGPNAPMITGGTLAANTTYTGSIVALNELETPAEDITEEVAEEDDEHQFFFQSISGANITTTYLDFDGDGNPLGINFTLATGDASMGTLRVTLRHLLDKFATGVSGGDITNAGGDTDIEVDYPITIQ